MQPDTQLSRAFPAATALPLRAMVALGLFAAAALLVFRQGWYPDLGALWLAAGFLADGQAGLVYAAPLPGPDNAMPAAWTLAAERAGFPEGGVTPYAYPPLWAALVAPLTRVMEAGTFFTLVLYLQAGLLGLAVLAARTATGAPLPTASWAIASAALMLLTAAASGPEGHPRLAVAILLLFAFERHVQDDPHATGALLALAAMLGPAPLLFFPLLLARRDLRALRSLAETAAALVLVSILLAGWPLHAEFLARQWQAWHALAESLFNEIVALLLFLPGNCLDMILQARGQTHDLFAPFPPLLGLALKAAAACGALVLALTARAHPAPRRTGQRLLALSLLPALAGPLGWTHHMPLALLLMPAALAWLPSDGDQGDSAPLRPLRSPL